MALARAATHPRSVSSRRFAVAIGLAILGLLAASCRSVDETASTTTTAVTDTGLADTTLISDSPDTTETVDQAPETTEVADEPVDEPSEPLVIPGDGAGLVADPEQLPLKRDDVPPAIVWEACGSVECATVLVPLDHRDPEGETVELAIARKAAAGESLGSIFVNFGGPGGETASRIETFSLPGDVGDSYDLIGWDPRGTGGSEPLNCRGAGPDQPAGLPDPSDGFDDELDVAIEVFDLVMACAAQQPVWQHIGTIDVVYDLDHLRRAIGEDELNYLGFSYGTQIGWVYASLFPDHVGQFVLDGGVLPGTFTTQSELGRYPVFDEAFERLDEGCDAVVSCPLNGEGMTETVVRLYDELDANPLVTGSGQIFGPVDLVNVVVTSTYFAPTQGGPLVADLIDQIDDGDAAPADNFLRSVNAGFEPAVFWSVICADGSGVGSEADALAGLEALTLIAPLTVGNGADLAFCDRIDLPVIGLPELDTTGAGPIMVVGSTGDPATPYAWSVGLAERLDEGHLLTYHGGGHTIVGRDGCIDFAVERFFVEGLLPPDGTQCGPRPTLVGILPDEVDSGLLIDDVSPGSGADAAGLRIGDIVETINGQPAESFSTLPTLPPGEVAIFGIDRDGEKFVVEVVPQLAPTDGWTVPIVPDLDLG